MDALPDRHRWVDYAKAVGIVLVVFGHVLRGLQASGYIADSTQLALVDSIIYSFHMPLFFFLSGLYLCSSIADRSATGFIAARIDTLAYPYIIWSLLQGSIEVAFSSYTNGTATLASVLSIGTRPRAQFWFLYALFAFSMLALLFLQWRGKHGRCSPTALVAMAMLAAAGYLLTPAHMDAGKNHFLVEWFSRFFVYFIAGALYGLSQRAHSSLNAMPMLVTLLFAAWMQYHFHVRLDLRHTDYGARSLALGFACIFAVVYLCRTLSAKQMPWLTAIGRACLPIFLMHLLLTGGFRIVSTRLFAVDSLAFQLIGGTLCGVLGPMVAMALLNRYRLAFLVMPKPTHSPGRWFLRLIGALRRRFISIT